MLSNTACVWHLQCRDRERVVQGSHRGWSGERSRAVERQLGSFLTNSSHSSLAHYGVRWWTGGTRSCREFLLLSYFSCKTPLTAAVLLWWGHNNNTWPGVQEDRRSRPESVLQYIVSRLNETSSSLIRWLTNKLCLLLLQTQAAYFSQFTLWTVWDSVYYCNIIWRVLAGWPPIGSRWPQPTFPWEPRPDLEYTHPRHTTPVPHSTVLIHSIIYGSVEWFERYSSSFLID